MIPGLIKGMCYAESDSTSVLAFDYINKTAPQGRNSRKDTCKEYLACLDQGRLHLADKLRQHEQHTTALRGGDGHGLLRKAYNILLSARTKYAKQWQAATLLRLGYSPTSVATNWIVLGRRANTSNGRTHYSRRCHWQSTRAGTRAATICLSNSMDLCPVAAESRLPGRLENFSSTDISGLMRYASSFAIQEQIKVGTVAILSGSRATSSQKTRNQFQTFFLKAVRTVE